MLVGAETPTNTVTACELHNVLPQMQVGQIMLGIDPDNSGAVAVIRHEGHLNSEQPAHTSTLQVHDMPLELQPAGKRVRKSVGTSCRNLPPLRVYQLVLSQTQRHCPPGPKCLVVRKAVWPVLPAPHREGAAGS